MVLLSGKPDDPRSYDVLQMKLRRITIDVPIDLTLAGLSQTSDGWNAAMQVPSTLYLQARRASTPQQAVDAAVKAVREGVERNTKSVAQPNLDELDI